MTGEMGILLLSYWIWFHFDTLKWIWIIHLFSTLIWRRLLKQFLVEAKDPFANID